MSDKYPGESGRRRFVKGVVGSATLASVGTGAAASIEVTTASTGQGGGITQYKAIENTAGPAPRGMPMVPIEIDGDGFIKGVWPDLQTVNEGGQEITVARTDDFKGSGTTYSSAWFQYCGVQTYEGIQPEFESDNYFKASTGTYDWQDEVYSKGDRLNIADFADYEEWGNGIGRSGIGKPGIATWRSEGTESTVPVQILRSARIEEMAAEDPWVDAATDQGVMAWLDKCTHFCCVPAFKAYGDSGKFGAEDRVYCQCHQSVYDPFSVQSTSFVALPRPDE